MSFFNLVEIADQLFAEHWIKVNKNNFEGAP